jgi:drug/metabolite transporter (DMT)-like permease
MINWIFMSFFSSWLVDSRRSTSDRALPSTAERDAAIDGATYFTALFVAFAPIALRGRPADSPRRLLAQALAPGLFYGVMIATHTLSMGLANVAYMIAVKRTSLLMAVGYGYFLFHEGHLRDRLAGATMMFAGLVLIVTAG